MEKNYIEFIFDKCMNVINKNYLVIFTSKADIEFSKKIYRYAYEKGYRNIQLLEYNYKNDNIIKEYILKDSEFLFIYDFSIFNTKAGELLKNLLMIDNPKTSIVESPSIMNDELIGIFNSKTPNIEISKYLSTVAKNPYKNYQIRYVDLQNFNNVNLYGRLLNQFSSIKKNNRIPIFPISNIGIKFDTNTVNGFVDATDDSYLVNSTIKDLRLDIKNGIVIDYDCKYSDDAKDFFKYNSFIDSLSLPYSIEFLPESIYITIKNEENNIIYIPINSSNLTIAGYNHDRSKIKIKEPNAKGNI